MKIVVFTLGCKVNQYESDGLIYGLKNMGHEVSTNLEFADIYILNSCAVTNEAEKKSRQTLAKFNALNPDAKIIVCGCASQKNSKQFENIKNVTYIKGTSNKLQILDLLNSNGKSIEDLPNTYNEEFITEPSKTRAHIKIQDGCNNFCSYCIIPYLRGRSRSRDVLSIIKEIETLSQTAKEIVITGINISDYRIDNKPALSKLLSYLKNYTKVRFRLGSIEQGILSENFFEDVENVNLCPHFHMSLQSGCDTVLKRMNRKYTTKEFLKTVKNIRKYYKNASITTDVIVGFPQETQKEFKKTCKFIKKVGFFNIHIFPYSIRGGTVAEKMQQVPSDIKKQRVKILTKINEKLNKKFINSQRKNILTLLPEEFDGEYYIGHTENYIKCYVQGECTINEFVNVKIIKQYKDGVIAKVID